MKPYPIEPPDDCAALLPGFDFADSFAVAAPPGIDAPAAVAKLFSRQPGWTRWLLDLRNKLVAKVGLKPAESAGFPVIAQSAAHVLLGFDDRHLDFRISVDREQAEDGTARIRVTTIVRTHNLAGRLYLRTVMPFHRLIVPTLLKRL